MQCQKTYKYKYRLVGDAFIDTGILDNEFGHPYFSMDKYGRLDIKERYMWDGISGPTINFKATLKASLPHDVLYQAIRLELLPPEIQKPADILLRDMLMEGNWLARSLAPVYYTMVKTFGHLNCRPGDIKEPKIITV